MSSPSETPTTSGGNSTGPHANPDELDKLCIEGFQGTPEEIERQWYEQVYAGRGDRMRQLT
jgi:hypothetical protein